jgi:hypothetical protein
MTEYRSNRGLRKDLWGLIQRTILGQYEMFPLFLRQPPGKPGLFVLLPRVWYADYLRGEFLISTRNR